MPPRSVVICTPSTNTSGSFDSDSEFAPRIRIRCAVPVVPFTSCMITPELRPPSASAKLVIGAGFSCSTSIADTCAPSSRDRCSRPVAALTITASSGTALVSSSKSATAVPPAVTVTVSVTCAYPISTARMFCSPVGTRVSR